MWLRKEVMTEKRKLFEIVAFVCVVTGKCLSVWVGDFTMLTTWWRGLRVSENMFVDTIAGHM